MLRVRLFGFVSYVVDDGDEIRLTDLRFPRVIAYLAVHASAQSETCSIFSTRITPDRQRANSAATAIPTIPPPTTSVLQCVLILASIGWSAHLARIFTIEKR